MSNLGNEDDWKEVDDLRKLPGGKEFLDWYEKVRSIDLPIWDKTIPSGQLCCFYEETDFFLDFGGTIDISDVCNPIDGCEKAEIGVGVMASQFDEQPSPKIWCVVLFPFGDLFVFHLAFIRIIDLVG